MPATSPIVARPARALLAVLAGLLPVHAQAVPDDRPAEPRDVLVLTASHQDDRAAPVTDVAHLHLHMPLHHLGCDVHGRAFADAEPDDLDPTTWRAVVVRVDGGRPAPAWLAGWLARQQRRGLRLVLLGDLAPLHAAAPDDLADLLLGCGLQGRGGWTDDPFRIIVDLDDPRRTTFESAPQFERRHQGPRSIDPGHDVWLSTRDRRDPDDVRHPVVTGDFGGLALDPWLLDMGGGDDASRWHLDPFRFFRKSLGLEGLPAADPCVRHGRRRFFFHVDGDGFESASTVHPGHVAGEVFRDEIVDRHRLPMTIGFVVASLTEHIDPDEPTRGMRVAREILRRPWVEPASHGMLHVLDWRRPLTRRTPPRSVVWYANLGGYHHSMIADVVESARFIDRHLAHPDRPCRLMLWSGAANPDAATLRATAEAGLLNLNGGVFRCDAATPTRSVIPPLGKRVGAGGLLQVYAGAANENVYAGFYDELPGAFAHVDQTLRRTGSPRILKPANIYAHFYSAERPARLRALHELLDTWALREPTCVTSAADWVQAVQDAVGRCRIARAPRDDGFDLRGFQHCRTLRFDGPTPPIDWSRSPGVVGARRIGDALYVDLGSATARLRWADAARRAPHLREANHPCTAVAREARGLRLTSAAVDGFDRLLVCAGFAARAPVRIRIGAATRDARADAGGRVTVRFSGSGPVPVEVVAR